MKNKELTFSEAQLKLEEIVSKIESNEIDLEALSIKLKEAKELVKFCEEKLRTFEENTK